VDREAISVLREALAVLDGLLDVESPAHPVLSEADSARYGPLSLR
jgi:hypothetical protein